MKKIISAVTIATIISATGFGQVNATMDNHDNGSNGMMNMNGIIKECFDIKLKIKLIL